MRGSTDLGWPAALTAALSLSFVVLTAPLAAGGPVAHPPGHEVESGPAAAQEYMYLIETTGDLTIPLRASGATYQAYFHIPIVTALQAPVVVDVASPELVDLRFVRQDELNVIAVATLRSAPPPTPLRWTALVLTRHAPYPAILDQAPVPTLDDIPADVRPWLQPTDCTQSDADLITRIASEVGEGRTRLVDLAQAVLDLVYAIPAEPSHSPVAFDAFYALSWGSTCTGHAHAAAALLRANGVPARLLHVIPAWEGLVMDMHWMIEYWVPGYGWARMGPTIGVLWPPTLKEVVTFVCRPEDEFPLFYPSGIEGHWHTSDPSLGVKSPHWGQAHSSVLVTAVGGSPDLVERAFESAQSVFELDTEAAGLGLADRQAMDYALASEARRRGVARLLERDLAGFADEMDLALEQLRRVRLQPLARLHFDDFESGPAGWTHGGEGDEWEVGVPSFGPAAAHSGSSCWATDLDGDYAENSDTWLMSPPFDLRGMAAAFLSFWVYNQVDDRNQGRVYDPLWLDVTADGDDFVPLCSHMGGGNDDPAIPEVGGWSHIVLDLTPYVGHEEVQIRFRFQSDGAGTQPGAYLDDVEISGRAEGPFVPPPRRAGGHVGARP